MKIANLMVLLVSSALLINNVTAKTLDDVKQSGYIKCGVSQSLPGFSFPDDNGNWSGLDVDMCRAVAAAIFNDPTKVRFIPLSAKERFTALQSGEIDILSRNTTWTFTRDTALGLDFTNVTYYDGQGFMLRKDLGVASVDELNGATLCTNTGTTTELNIADYFNSKGMDYQIVTFEKADEVVAAYNAGRCDVYTTDKSGLAAQKVKLSDPAAHIILSDTISKEPLGPVVRHNDNNWSDIVRWVIFGMLVAEEKGINSKNIHTMFNSSDPEIQRLLGINANLGEYLGLSHDFMVNVIKNVGNYQEVFDNNVGSNSQLQLPRGLNKLWNKGGIMYAPPFR